MQTFDFLTQEHIYICADIQSKNQLLERLSFEMAHISGLDEENLLKEFMARETVCSTGLGHGIALPHVRMNDLTTPLGSFFLLKSPINFESTDNTDVDLVFALATPANETCQHLKITAKIVEAFSGAAFRDTIRTCTSSQSIFNLLQHPEITPPLIINYD